MMRLPEKSEGSVQPTTLMKGIEGYPRWVLDDDLEAARSPAARRLDVGLAELIQQVGAHDSCEARGAVGADDDHRHPEVLEEVYEFSEAPRSVNVLSRVETA